MVVSDGFALAQSLATAIGEQHRRAAAQCWCPSLWAIAAGAALVWALGMGLYVWAIWTALYSA